MLLLDESESGAGADRVPADAPLSSAAVASLVFATPRWCLGSARLPARVASDDESVGSARRAAVSEVVPKPAERPFDDRRRGVVAVEVVEHPLGALVVGPQLLSRAPQAVIGSRPPPGEVGGGFKAVQLPPPVRASELAEEAG